MGNEKDEKGVNPFKEAVACTPDIKDGYRSGLQALGNNAQSVKAEDTRKVEGSVDIDACTLKAYPESPRWDYAIGYDGKAYFLEVHPASTGNVKDMVKKAEWLKRWLKEKAPALGKLAAGKTFHWVPSGKHAILPGTRESRLLAQSNILLARQLRLPT